MTIEPPLYVEIVDFWRDAGPRLWFARNEAFDTAIRDRFETAQHAAGRGDYAGWPRTAEGALALVLLLDQFPRNLYRGQPQAFATDPLAREAASNAIAVGHDLATDRSLRAFFYLPFEHAEDPADQDRAMALMQALGDADYLRYAELHREVIRRFGRFPHRNAILGRESTADEIAYLAGPGFKG